ncbi:hypothetical protein [Sphingosinicella sp.]|uniref:hypothetical protein n=1 Tax=Sphingosinicella sp. TaxID=1917971 RepID=UPI0035B1A45F
MADQTPAPAPTTTPAVRDAHGFNPDDYEWIPVARQRRSDGWTPQRQREFIEALADTGSVVEAARAVNMSANSCYRLRRAPGAEGFAAAWEAAIANASRRLVDIAFDRAVNGVEDAVLDRDGNVIHIRTRYNDRLLMFLLRAHHPERYRAPDHRRRAVPATETAATNVAVSGAIPATLPAPSAIIPDIARALDTLMPVCPPDPHKRMHPEDLENLIFNNRDD